MNLNELDFDLLIAILENIEKENFEIF
jgi:hypothetical protein